MNTAQIYLLVSGALFLLFLAIIFFITLHLKRKQSKLNKDKTIEQIKKAVK